MNVFDLLRDINEDDSIGKTSSTRSKRMTESISRLTEAYSVKFGLNDKGEESFDDLNSAIKYINDQIKKYEHSTLALYNDGKELIILDRMKDRQGQDLGFSISRHNDKSLDFDKSKGLFVVEKDIDDKTLRASFMKTIQEMGYINEAAYFGRNMKFAYTTDKPSYIDFDKKIIYYNRDEQIQKSIEKIVSEYRANKSKLKEYYDEEAPLGRDSTYPGYGGRSGYLGDPVPKWWTDSGRTASEWKNRARSTYRHDEETGREWEYRSSRRESLKFDSNANSLNEYYDEECPNGRDTPYCYDPVKPLPNVAPQWWKDQGGTDASWRQSQRNDRDRNNWRNAWESVETKKGNRLTEDEDAVETTGNSAESIVQGLKTADYEEFVKILNSDGKSKAFFDYLKNHYKMGDDAIGTIKKCSASEGVIACGKLIPTQKNISVVKSLDFIKSPGWSEKIINDPITAFNTPTITYNGQYIIDGHHRWSKVYALHGPNAKIKVLNFPAIPGVSWEDMLKAVQLAIRFNAQNLDLRNKVDNPNMLEDKTGKISASVYLENACDVVVNAMKEKGYGETKEEQAKKVAVNVAAMAKRGAVPGAEPREWMPQTDKIDNTGEAVERTLKTQGVIDITEDLDDDITSLEGLGYMK